MLTPIFINPFCTGIIPGPRFPDEDHNDKRDPIHLGGCLTNADEDPFYSKEELKERIRRRGE